MSWPESVWKNRNTCISYRILTANCGWRKYLVALLMEYAIFNEFHKIICEALKYVWFKFNPEVGAV
jgi:hypothetical protein